MQRPGVRDREQVRLRRGRDVVASIEPVRDADHATSGRLVPGRQTPAALLGDRHDRVRVVERPAIADKDIASAKDAVRADLLNERRNQFFSAYMAKARERMQININQQTIAQLLA